MALAYGVFALFLLGKPGTSGDFAADWIVLIGFGIVFVVGLVYLLIARPDKKSNAAEGDAIAVAEKLRAGKKQRRTHARKPPGPASASAMPGPVLRPLAGNVRMRSVESQAI